MAFALFEVLIATAALILEPAHAAGTASYNGLAVTPQMGWDNWNAFGCKINQELLLTTAQRIVDFGLRDLGMILFKGVGCEALSADKWFFF